MSTQKLSAEASLEKRTGLVHGMLRDVLLGTILWYVLVRLSGFFGLPHAASASAYVAGGVVALLLLASWRANRRERREPEGTTARDCCNSLKLTDHQADCSGGGRHPVLMEIKWTSPKPSKPPSSMRECWLAEFTENPFGG